MSIGLRGLLILPSKKREFIRLQRSVQGAEYGRKDQVKLGLTQRRRKFASIQLIGGLAYYDLEVRSSALPRARGVVQARSRAANAVYPHWCLVMDSSDALEGRREKMLISGIFDIGGKKCSDIGQAEISQFGGDTIELLEVCENS